MLGTYFNVANAILSSTENLHFNTVIPATLAASYDLGFNQSTSSSTCAFKEDNNITFFEFFTSKIFHILLFKTCNNSNLFITQSFYSVFLRLVVVANLACLVCKIHISSSRIIEAIHSYIVNIKKLFNFKIINRICYRNFGPSTDATSNKNRQCKNKTFFILFIFSFVTSFNTSLLFNRRICIFYNTWCFKSDTTDIHNISILIHHVFIVHALFSFSSSALRTFFIRMTTNFSVSVIMYTSYILLQPFFKEQYQISNHLMFWFNVIHSIYDFYLITILAIMLTINFFPV